MAEAKIRFQVEGMDSIHSGLEQLKRDAESLSSVFEAHNATITSQLKEQLELLRQRNSMLNPTVPNNPPQTPPIGTSLDSSNQDLIIKDLTSRVDTLITILTNQGIRINDETISRLGGGMGPQPPGSDSFFSRGIKSGLLLKGLSLIEDPLYQSFSGSLWAPNTVARNIALKRTGGGFLGGLGSLALGGAFLAGGPVGWGLAIGGLAAKGIGAALNYDSESDDRVSQIFQSSSNQRALLSSLYGLPPQAWAFEVARQYGGAGFGFTQAQALDRIASYTMARGFPISQKEGARLFALERALPLSQNDIGNVASSLKTVLDTKGNRNVVSSSITSLYNNLLGVGISESRVKANITDYLKILVNLNQSQADRLGSIDSRDSFTNIEFISKLAKVAPNQIGKIGQISSALDSPINPDNPYQSALLYSSIRNIYGDVGLWGVERIKSEGLLKNPKLLQSLFNTASSWSGGNEDLTKIILYKDLLSQFGLNPQDIDLLYKTYKGIGFTAHASAYSSLEDNINYLEGNSLIKEGVRHTPIELIDTARKELKDLYEGTVTALTNPLENYNSSLEAAGEIVVKAAGEFADELKKFTEWYQINVDANVPPVIYRP